VLTTIARNKVKLNIFIMPIFSFTVLQKYGFLAIRYAFFGRMPKPITSPQPKPQTAQPIESTSFEAFQFQPSESKDSSLLWSKTVIDSSKELSQNDNKEKPFLLSENDNNELQRRNLDIEKGAIVKPYWAKEISRFNAAKTINTKGLSESVISKYYAAFNTIHYSQSIENQ
jgi:hypothetical protein